MKKLLSIILASSMLCSSSFAAPVMVPVVESSAEIGTEQAVPSDDVFTQSEAPSITMTYVTESVEETAGNETPDNLLTGDAMLMAFGYSGGDGTEEAPYEISDAAGLKYFSQSINTGYDIDCHFKLTSDIDLGGEEWTPVGYYTASTKYERAFKGSFDGGGHTISNFKITSGSTPYLGFFGFVYNGEIKNLNLDGVTVDIDRTNPEEANIIQSYVGIVAGRIVGDGIGGKSSVTNCHVTNSSIDFVSDKDSYVGGLVGFMIAGVNSEFDVFNVSAECDVTLSVNASDFKEKEAGKVPVPFQAFGSALLGYYGSLTDSSITLRKAYSEGNVTVDSLASPYVHVFAGGIVAQSATKVTSQTGGEAHFSACYSAADISAKAQLFVFAGGFSGNIASTENFFISDCYASGDTTAGSYGALWYSSVYGSVKGYSAIGGFVGQIDFDNYNDSMGKPVSSCYSSGDVIYSKVENAKHEESYEGGFVGYSFAPLFAGCYILEDQTISGLEVFEDDGIVLVSSQASKTQDGYPDFDFDSAWTFDASGDYPYPVLKDIKGIAQFYSDGEYFGETYYGDDGKVFAPKAVPTKQETVEYVYTFSHWSLTEDGEAFDFENGVVEGDTYFYAVFSAKKQVYKVSFVSNGNTFGKALDVEYGSLITLTNAVPSKSETAKYRYEFDYWSLTENGSEVDFDTYTVTGNVTLYAVFLEINKSAWKGEVATQFSNGYGTKSLPYIITTAEEFALFAKVINEGDSGYKNAYFTLGNDIHLGYNDWTPIGTSDNPYKAYLDGNGYSVSCFVVDSGDYAGLFGYIHSGTVKNLIVSEFEIDYSDYTSYDSIYAGGLAGYITAKGSSTPSIIDSVYVSPSKFEISADAKTIYAGSIAGYVSTDVGKSLITNSYASGDISVTNGASGSLVYAGGLFGYMYTYSLSLANASSCYFTGSVTAQSDTICYAGGIAGMVDSYGSGFLPPVSTSDSEVFAEIKDYDVMLDNCFAAANVSSTVTGESLISKAYAGAIAATVTQFAAVENVYYQRNKAVTSSTNTIYSCDNAVSVSEASLVSKDFVGGTVGFDFTNTWTYISSIKYPVLKVMYSDKPILRIDSLTLEDGVLSAKVISFSPVQSYTVVVAVYNERNQLIASKRMTYKSSEAANELEAVFDGLRQPYRIKVSAMDTSTFVPLFTAIERFV